MPKILKFTVQNLQFAAISSLLPLGLPFLQETVTIRHQNLEGHVVVTLKSRTILIGLLLILDFVLLSRDRSAAAQRIPFQNQKVPHRQLPTALFRAPQRLYEELFPLQPQLRVKRSSGHRVILHFGYQIGKKLYFWEQKRDFTLQFRAFRANL